MAKLMLEKFEKYRKITSVVLAITSILDIRYKLKLVENYFHIIYNSFELEKINHVKSCFQKIFDEYIIHSSSCSMKGNQSCQENFSSQFPSSRLPEISDFGTRVGLANFIEESSSNQTQKSKLDLYLEEKVHPRI
jgi:Domain of unknown function (DUF4413)